MEGKKIFPGLVDGFCLILRDDEEIHMDLFVSHFFQANNRNAALSAQGAYNYYSPKAVDSSP